MQLLTPGLDDREQAQLAGIRRGFVVAATCASLVLPQAARAAVGSLSSEGCVHNTGGSACNASGGTAAGIDGPIAVAVSPDGRDVYAASLDDSAIALFARTSAGPIATAGCIQNPTGSDCTGIGGTTKGLSGASDVALSPDGGNVYVVANESDAIVTFDRSINGSLTPAGCISDESESALCSTSGGNTPGLLSATAVAVSPDGANVYVASFLSNAVVTFNRAGDGTLTPAGCIQSTGGTACSGSGGTTPGLVGAYDVTVSPDGDSVYVASYTSDAVVTFSRAASGQLTPQGCIQNTGGNTCSGTGGTAPGLSGPRSVAVSPDGDNLYVAAFLSDAIAVFDRAPNGTLAAAGCIQNTGGTLCTAPEDTTPGLDGPSSVLVSPDGMNVYAASTFSDAIVEFARDDTDGALTPLECIQNTGRSECSNAGGSTTPGLDGAFDVAVSPGGSSVYVAAFNSDSIAVFSREGFPTTTSMTSTTTTTDTSITTTTTTTTTTTLPPLGTCADWNNDKKVTVTDALAILKASVGGNQCNAVPCVCDVAGGGSVLASDALAALRLSVGLNVALNCHC